MTCQSYLGSDGFPIALFYWRDTTVTFERSAYLQGERGAGEDGVLDER